MKETIGFEENAYDNLAANAIVKSIKEMKTDSYNKKCLMSVRSLQSYFSALFTFGANSNVTKESLTVIKEMANIHANLKQVLKYMLRNIDSFDLEAMEEVVRFLKQTEYDTYSYYNKVICALDTSCKFRNPRCSTPRPASTLPTFRDDFTYASTVVALDEDLDSIKEFLGYSDEFWEFIKTGTQTVDATYEISSKMVYAIPLNDQDGNVSSIKVLLPVVRDIKTALLAIKVLNKAFAIWSCYGKPYSAPNLDENESFLVTKYKVLHLNDKAEKKLNLRSVK